MSKYNLTKKYWAVYGEILLVRNLYMDHSILIIDCENLPRDTEGSSSPLDSNFKFVFLMIWLVISLIINFSFIMIFLIFGSIHLRAQFYILLP